MDQMHRWYRKLVVMKRLAVDPGKLLMPWGKQVVMVVVNWLL